MLTLAHKAYEEMSRILRFHAKRQMTGAVQDASRFSGIIVPRAASWSAAALRRFSKRHIKLCQC
jgi:Flp pilus assembly CpaF family ATPase